MAVHESHPTPAGRSWIGGFILIAVGAILLASNIAGVGGEAVVLAVGLAFLVAYWFRREYGFLVPAGILTGLGAGVLWQTTSNNNGGSVVLGLGLGFLVIYAIDYLATGAHLRWWPLIPGGILSVIGVSLLASQYQLVAEIGRWWPALLVIGGIWLLLTRRR